jgi:Ca2+-binding RTX toxin-like protein
MSSTTIAPTSWRNDTLDYSDSQRAVRVEASRGHDIITGSPFHDTIFGGTGNDLLEGGNGADEIHGGGGDDIIYGEFQVIDPLSLTAREGGSVLPSDIIYGGSGNDGLIVDGGQDNVYGNEGNDTLIQRQWNDTSDNAQLYGGAGNDTLRGGGASSFFGGNGKDTLIAHNTDLVSANYDGGNGRRDRFELFVNPDETISFRQQQSGAVDILNSDNQVKATLTNIEQFVLKTEDEKGRIETRNITPIIRNLDTGDTAEISMNEKNNGNGFLDRFF